MIVRDRSYFMGQLRVVQKGSERRLQREGSPIQSEGGKGSGEEIRWKKVVGKLAKTRNYPDLVKKHNFIVFHNVQMED